MLPADAGPLVLGAVLGAVIGAATAVVQPHLGLPWSALVNSASPWLLGGFAAGALAGRRGPAVGAGLLACLVEVSAYYSTATAMSLPVDHGLTAFWLACALVGGTVAGLAGWAWRRGTGRVRAYGAAFPGGTFIAEAVGAYGLRLHYHPAVAMFLIIGVALLALLIRNAPWPGILAWTAVFVVAGALVYGPLLNAVVGANSGGVSFGPLGQLVRQARRGGRRSRRAGSAHRQ
ncbi:MAG: DUF6518 family protein [Trebonia sp.]|jgi:hypothetical protein